MLVTSTISFSSDLQQCNSTQKSAKKCHYVRVLPLSFICEPKGTLHVLNTEPYAVFAVQCPLCHLPRFILSSFFSYFTCVHPGISVILWHDVIGWEIWTELSPL